MKRFLSLLLAAIMLLSMVSIANAEEWNLPEKVEISFKVGDSTLMINSNPVSVETPYVAGAGTTLVPLRVITEAFGARVTWVNDTKEIILEYPDVNITLQIGNKNATVNTHTETLPEAPVLSPNGVTMVPLRFISETFGATVGYDNDTKAITVVKETVGENTTISSSTDLPKIGDSYWNWAMLTPKDMMMTDRYLDGSHTLFEGDEDVEFSINIYTLPDYETVEYNTYYREVRDDMKAAFTLSKDEKTKDADGNDYFRLVGRDKEEYMDVFAVYKDNKAYVLCFTCPAGYEKIRSLTAIIESFKPAYINDNQTHDLSNVEEDGYRLVKDEDLKISFKVPAAMSEVQADRMNLMWFASDKKNDPTQVTVGVYSKGEGYGAKEMAIEDKTFHDLYTNLEKTNTSDIAKYTTVDLGENAYYYVYGTKNLTDGNYSMCDIYFEKGDYIYNVTINQPEGSDGILKKVMETLKVEELDSEEFGVMLKEKREDGEYTSSTNNWEMKLNEMWSEVSLGVQTSATSEASVFLNSYTSSTLSMVVVNTATKPHELEDFVKELYAQQKGKVVEKLSEGVSDSNAYYKFTLHVPAENDDEVSHYSTVYVLKLRTKVVMFQLDETEEFAFARGAEDVEKFIGTFKLK